MLIDMFTKFKDEVQMGMSKLSDRIDSGQDRSRSRGRPTARVTSRTVRVSGDPDDGGDPDDDGDDDDDVVVVGDVVVILIGLYFRFH